MRESDFELKEALGFWPDIQSLRGMARKRLLDGEKNPAMRLMFFYLYIIADQLETIERRTAWLESKYSTAMRAAADVNADLRDGKYSGRRRE